MKDKKIIGGYSIEFHDVDELKLFKYPAILLHIGDYRRTRDRIVKFGLTSTFVGCKIGKKIYAVTNYIMLMTLKRMKKEGFRIPHVGVNIIWCKNVPSAMEVAFQFRNHF